MGFISNFLKDQSDLFLVIGITGILIVLFTPIPSELLDFLLITNFSFALLILLLTFYVEKPLQFSTFPSLLLIATLFRLALNIAATRLILSDTNAGRVIGTIGTHVVSGNYVIGMIVFIVLIVVQYVVVTNGAQRVAEVAARFTLDGMPGKQMSIDADLNMGLINEEQAQERRREIEREANFYGAMDGASKFVKGDAIAGIIIVLIDIIGGLTIGIAQKGMSWGDALHTFTLLTIGDGIVTQIPALVISTGTGIIVTRAASDNFLSQEIANQITAYPKTLILVCAALGVGLFLPGIPPLPILILMMISGILAVFAARRKTTLLQEDTQENIAEEGNDDIYGMLPIEPLEINVGQNLIPLVGRDDNLMFDRITSFRKQYALDAGFVIPKVRVKDEKKMAPNSYEIFMYGAKLGSGELIPDRVLAINPGNVTEKLEGIEAKDPTYGLPAVWITEDKRRPAKQEGYTVVEPISVLMTHLIELIKQQSPNLLTRAETERILETVKARDAGLVEELIPNILSLTDTQKVLQGLLREKVSIRNLQQILEVLADVGKQSKDFDVLIENVRQRLGPVICQSLLDNDGSLYVLVLDPRVERTLTSGVREDAERRRLVVEPKFAEELISKLLSQVEKMMLANLMPVLLCAPELRRHIRGFTERVAPQLSILSMSEVPNTINIKSFGMISV